MYVTGHAHAAFEGAPRTLQVARLWGDATGWLEVRAGQVLRAEVREGVSTHLRARVNLRVSAGGTLHVPARTTLARTSLELRGRATFQHLVVDQGGVLELYDSAATATYSSSSGAYTDTSAPGSLYLTSLTVHFGARVTPRAGLRIGVERLHLKRHVAVIAAVVDVTAVTVVMERGSQLSVARQAARGAPGDSAGAGGGAYASGGGVGRAVPLAEATRAYGTMYAPIANGSSSTSGARGASFIRIRTAYLYLDGRLNADGGASEAGGGGSGGSIYVVCSAGLYGLGSMTADGGDTRSPDAGAGSGGRIAVYSQRSHFSGAYSATGGRGPAPHGDGGPGSVYTRQGSELRRDLVENLLVDNRGGQRHHYLTLSEADTRLRLDSVQMRCNAKLQMVADGRQRSLQISKVPRLYFHPVIVLYPVISQAVTLASLSTSSPLCPSPCHHSPPCHLSFCHCYHPAPPVTSLSITLQPLSHRCPVVITLITLETAIH